MVMPTVPLYVLVLVIAGAVALGTSISLFIWWLCCCRNRGKDGPLRRKQVIKYKPKDIRTSTSEVHRHSASGFMPPPLSPRSIGHDLMQDHHTAIVPIQPASDPHQLRRASLPETSDFTPIAASAASYTSVHSYRRSHETGGGEESETHHVAKIKLTVFYKSKSNELCIQIVEIGSFSDDVSPQHAYVEMRQLHCPNSKLKKFHLIRKGGKLKGVEPGNQQKFEVNPAEILTSQFNFYLWSINKYSRDFQAGKCLLSFENKTLADFSNDGGFAMTRYFAPNEREDTSDCPVMRVLLRYNNRSNKLVCIVGGISNVPKLGWRTAVPHALADKFIVSEPSPEVKVTLSREGAEPISYRTKPVRGYNPTFKDARFTFDVTREELQQVRLTLEAAYTNLRITHKKLGTLEFSDQSTGSEGEHWREMLQLISKDGLGVTKDHAIRAHPRWYVS